MKHSLTEFIKNFAREQFIYFLLLSTLLGYRVPSQLLIVGESSSYLYLFVKLENYPTQNCSFIQTREAMGPCTTKDSAIQLRNFILESTPYLSIIARVRNVPPFLEVHSLAHLFHDNSLSLRFMIIARHSISTFPDAYQPGIISCAIPLQVTY